MSKRIFGQELVLDLHNCKTDLITDREVIREYVTTLCDKIDMKRYGEP